MKGALDGVKVIDFSRVLAGPFCTMNLADFGAEVIKIERPVLGDDSRFFGPFQNEESSYYIYVNRGKKSITLDLKDPNSIAVIKEMVKEADVVVENFKPGVMKKLGLHYEALKDVNPEIIYCSISGFGQDGPYAERPAYDIVAQAMGGIMSITGYPDGQPARVGCSLGDISSGLYAAFGITTALYHRMRTGEGQFIDIAMMDSVFSFLESNVMRHTVQGITPSRLGGRHPISAPFDIFQARDGLLIIAIASDAHFEIFSELTGHPGWKDEVRFSSDRNRAENQQALKDLIEAWLADYTVNEAITLMSKVGIPCSEILDIAQICSDPHIKARDMLVSVNHPIAGEMKIPGNPVKFSNTPPQIRSAGPLLGEHNDEFLGEMIKNGN